MSSQQPPTSHPLGGGAPDATEAEAEASEASAPPPPALPAQLQNRPGAMLSELLATEAKRARDEQRLHATGRISFWRNGRSMGTAFTHVRILPGSSTLAYFPAVSLSQVGDSRDP